MIPAHTSTSPNERLPVVPALVVGRVHHVRHHPPRSFTHGHYQWLIDLADPPTMRGPLRALADVRAADHLGGVEDFEALRGEVIRRVRTEGIDLPEDVRIVMLAHARVLGHVFDPMSVFWCLDPGGVVLAALVEVHNTYAGRHAYVVRPDERGRCEITKDFYVSPFTTVDGSYAVRLRLSARRVSASVELRQAGRPVLTASVSGVVHPVSAGRLLRVAVRYPLMPQRVSALIKAHGILLWLRRHPITPRQRIGGNAAARPTTGGQATLKAPMAALGSTGSAPVDGATADPTQETRIEPPGRHTLLTRGRIAAGLVRMMVAPLPVRVTHPDGSVLGGGGPDDPTLQVVRPEVLYRRLETHPKIGLGEGYMAGDWRAADGTDLAAVLTPFAARMGSLLPRPILALRGVLERAHPPAQRNTPEGARANIAAHYDLSNDLFAAFLDETMTYSSALFDPGRPVQEQSLAQAQHRKIDAVLDAAGVGPGTRVLEIGTGWGELAVRAARRGAHVTTLTLSSEQAELAEAKIAAAGLSDRVQIRLADYRTLLGGTERFDAVVSVEMIEAVGEEFWPDYLRTIDTVLDPSGRAVLQAILMSHERLMATRRSHGWIQKHIFPGGLIPSVRALQEASTRHTRLEVTDVARFGAHYAHTLRLWRLAFLKNWPTIESLGFDEVFRRTWEFYLAYCEAGFAAGYLDVAHLTLRRTR